MSSTQEDPVPQIGLLDPGAHQESTNAAPALTESEAPAACAGLPSAWARTVELLEEHPDCGRLPDWLRTNLRAAAPAGWEGSAAVISIPSQLTREWIDRKYRPLLEELLSGLLGTPVELRLNVAPPAPGKRKDPTASKPRATTASSANATPAPRRPAPEVTRARAAELLRCAPLNTRLSFETFVEGGNNRFALAAATAVAHAPGQSYNPLFVHGGVGLGKTHLLQAVGQQIQQRQPDAVVAYLSGEAFTSSFVGAIRERRMEEFRTVYRSVDVWLVDDVQFIASKERTGEEFYHTFNALYETGKQVVICADRPPAELRIFDDRLVSRFQAGLVADIGSPDYETRLAILERKLDLEGMRLPGEVVQLMARMIQSNIRVLEGALIRLLAHASFTNAEINLSMATALLSRYFDEGRRAPIPVERVQRVVCDALDVPLEALAGKKRDRRSLLARQMAMFLSRELTDSSLEQIGALFGGKDHSTVAHACRTFRQTIDSNPDVERQTAHVRERIRRSK